MIGGSKRESTSVFRPLRFVRETCLQARRYDCMSETLCGLRPSSATSDFSTRFYGTNAILAPNYERRRCGMRLSSTKSRSLHTRGELDEPGIRKPALRQRGRTDSIQEQKSGVLESFTTSTSVDLTKVDIEMDMREEKLCIRGVCLNYLKIGNGEHPVLLLPGAMGTMWTNFKPQLQDLDRNGLTIVAWDPPGYGQSRPPTREFSDDFLQRDATYAHDLMKALGCKTFSMIGWCNGGITACFLAAMYPDSVRGLILIGTHSYILPEEMLVYIGIQNVDKWTEKMLKPLADIYGEDYVRSVWPAYVDAMRNIYQNRKGNICMDFLEKIHCPTLIVHGENDWLIKISHAITLKENIRDSRIRTFKNGGHDPHLRYSKEFNGLAADFLLHLSDD